MKKSLIALFLVFSLLLVAVGCTAEQPRESTSNQVSEQTKDSEKPSETEKETEKKPTPSIKVETEPEGEDPDAGNRLIYFEDFENYSTTLGSEALLSAMSWEVQSTKDGAYSTSTAIYSIEEHGSSKQLYLKNNKTGGTDSYVVLLSSEAMGRFHQKNYTYQFDMEYADGANASRYIALVSSYNGWFYNSFHLRTAGRANNECHQSNQWLAYDAEGENYAASTDQNAIVTKLLGKTYSSSTAAMQGVSLSIRYVTDWQNGNSVYIRINDAGYPGSGKWTLVSKASTEGEAEGLFKPELGGAAIVLKTGGKQNGYIDNIVVWEGTGDEPADKSEPLLTSASGCTRHIYEGVGTCKNPKKCVFCGRARATNASHYFVAVEGTGDAQCTQCSAYESAVKAGWKLEKLPVYSGGIFAKELYLSGHGLDDASFSTAKETLTQVICDTSASQFDAYCSKLVKYGFTKVFNRTADSNKYAEFTKGKELVYVYFTASCGEVRIIYDGNGSSTSVKDFSYAYTKKSTDTTVLYQYGLSMSSTGMGINNPSNTEKKINCGMLYVLKLADNSVIIIDGGGYQQFDDTEADNFMAFLREITGQSSGKIKIAAWYISHCHPDHVAGFSIFVKKHNASLDFDRIMFNFPSINSEQPCVVPESKNSYDRLVKYFSDYIKDDGVKFMKLHTGQKFNIGDATIDVIYTHEDAVNSYGGWGEFENDFNNSSSVIKITFDQKTFMVLGDINQPAMNVILANNSDSTLKSDIVQMAHHVINDVSDLYHKIQAPVVLVPQSREGADRGTKRKAAHAAAKTYVTNDMIYYAQEETVGLAVQNGTIKKVHSSAASTLAYGGWYW